MDYGIQPIIPHDLEYFTYAILELKLGAILSPSSAGCSIAMRLRDVSFACFTSFTSTFLVQQPSIAMRINMSAHDDNE